MRVAVIDLGTNTFNLLIAEAEKGDMKILFSDRLSVRLGRGGIRNNIIQPDAFERGIAALEKHNKIIEKYSVEKVIGIGTSALRTAKNACDFINASKDKLGIVIEIISGDREAELIYKGVLQSIENISGDFLIIDIGGGSNELIIANSKKIIWKKSFKLGIERIISKFDVSDPILPGEIKAIEEYFEKELQPFFGQAKNFIFVSVIGAEGSFETFFNMVELSRPAGITSSLGYTSKVIDLSDYLRLHNILLGSTSHSRKMMKGLESFRADMIVAASLFVHSIINRIEFREMRVSPFSMKEGAAWEILQQFPL
jgi:exopolyphosphatase / guanosine-5'-triphosphate,3'-diphosphate pyrophosphatase